MKTAKQNRYSDDAFWRKYYKKLIVILQERLSEAERENKLLRAKLKQEREKSDGKAR